MARPSTRSRRYASGTQRTSFPLVGRDFATVPLRALLTRGLGRSAAPATAGALSVRPIKDPANCSDRSEEPLRLSALKTKDFMPPASTTTSRSSRSYADASSVDELERIPFLPDTPVALDAALEQEHRTARRSSASESTVAPGRYLGLYLKYVALFVGAGLISGSIVHYPLDKTRYIIIGAVGAVLFALASTFADARAKGNGPASLVKFVLASLVLALGIGMISGGIQHFSDIPTRAATLIPLGGALSIIAFAIRDGHRLTRRHMVPFAVAGSAALLWVAIGLSQYAGTFEVPAAGADHHGAAAEPASTEAAASDHTETTADAHAAEASSEPAAAAHAAEESTAAAPPAEAAQSTDDSAVAEDHSAHGH